MVKVEDIETALNEAVEIQFKVGFIKNSDNSVVLTFKNPEPTIAYYESLLDGGNPQVFTLVLYRKGDLIDVSIIDEQTSDIVNIKELFFKPGALETFTKYVSGITPIAFILADLNQTIYVTHRKLFFTKYIVI